MGKRADRLRQLALDVLGAGDQASVEALTRVRDSVVAAAAEVHVRANDMRKTRDGGSATEARPETTR